MAGQGSRFTKAGWTTPKPLIEFAGKMMIEHVLDSFPKLPETRFVLIVREDFLSDQRKQIEKLLARGNIDFVVARQVTQGAACSVLLARKFFKGRSLLVADSDTFYRDGVLADFLKEIQRNSPGFGLLTFKSCLECYSYVNLTLEGTLDQIAEKQVISENAISGVYYFANGDAFEEAAVQAMIYGDRDRGEFYLSKIFGNAARESGTSVLLHDVTSEDMFCAGTPDQLQEVIKRLSK